MKNYRLEANTDYDRFCDQVRRAQEEGWILRGSEMVVEGKYVQCFVNADMNQSSKNN